MSSLDLKSGLPFNSPEELEEKLASVDAGMAVTRGTYAGQSRASVQDLDWNHMDPHHRPYIHRTYGKSLRLCSGSDYQVSNTKYGRWPLFLTVVDTRLGPGLFYQCLSVLGIATIISVIRAFPQSTGSSLQVDWYIVSKRLWKIFHPWLSRKLERLNREQNAEDEPIRNRRADLRAIGFTFRSDKPDFLISSALTPSLVPPVLKGEHAISLGEKTDGALLSCKAGDLEFLYHRQSDGAVVVWPGACPHEGGPLAQSLTPPESGRLKCPWHGLEYRGTRLSPDSPLGECLGARLRLDGKNLVISPGS